MISTASTPSEPAQSRQLQPDPAAARPIALPELLAPAGDWECARAAVENGADAIYFGLDRFNARMRAKNFTIADLPSLMEFLHRRGVRGYVSFNTLIFANELADAEQTLRAIIAVGVDAAIVQDVGICRLIRRLSPDFPIHASTQLTITSSAGVEFDRELGCDLVVLARECSLKEIDRIQAALVGAQTCIAPAPLPLEVFVHGALCVAYSGQCLTSESLGGRSANRGECAQACRMPYDLISDGQQVPLGDRRYLLSPQDLAGIELLPDLVRLGIRSLKIEGRLKAPEYVANITRLYRKALDRLAASATGESVAASPELKKEDRYEMEMAFSRGLYTGWFGGVNNQELVHARFGKKRGVYLGEVIRVHGHQVHLRLEGSLKPGDGIVFDAGQPDVKEEGGRVYAVQPRGAEVALAFGEGDIDFRRIQPGNKLWKTSDPQLERRLRRSFEEGKTQHQQPIAMEVSGRVGEPLIVSARDQVGTVVQAKSAMPLVQAQAQPLTSERLREQLGRLGGTPLRLGHLQNHLEGEVMLPVSELNRVRREIVALFESERSAGPGWTLIQSAGCQVEGELPTPRPVDQAQLVVLARTLGQLEAAWRAGVHTLYCEFEDPKKYREATARFRAWKDGQAGELFVAPPRITKPGEEWILKLVRSSEADGYLVRNYDQLALLSGCRLVGDFSLNVANGLSAEYFMKRPGMERVTASYDLNDVQLEALLQSAPPEWFELTIHQHMPMFHMEHCVFCAFLSKGTDYTNCGRPCDHHDLKLRDRVGAEHPVKADAGCRNTVYNALAQTGAEYVGRLLQLGARRFRLEFLNETPDQVARTIPMYQALLRGEVSGATVWRELKLRHQLGVTRGSQEKLDRAWSAI